MEDDDSIRERKMRLRMRKRLYRRPNETTNELRRRLYRRPNETTNEPRNDNILFLPDHGNDESVSLSLNLTERNMDEERDAIREIRMRQIRQITQGYSRPNETTNEPRNDDFVFLPDRGNDESVSLNLDLTLDSSQNPLVAPPPRGAPPLAFLEPMTTWQTEAGLMPPPMASASSPYSPPLPMGSAFSPYSLLRNSLHLQPGSRGLFPTPIQPPPVNNFSLTPPSNQATPAAMRPVNTGVNKSRSRPARNRVPNMIAPPFPWARNIEGKIHTLEYLQFFQITTITGEVQCKHCKNAYEVSYNLGERFVNIEMYFKSEKSIMRDRAPTVWLYPKLLRCELCGHDDVVKPVIPTETSQINWLFLLLGETLGFCTLAQLKDFCKHSSNHRTGAKDRVLYLTYMGLCKMLKPEDKLFGH